LECDQKKDAHPVQWNLLQVQLHAQRQEWYFLDDIWDAAMGDDFKWFHFSLLLLVVE